MVRDRDHATGADGGGVARGGGQEPGSKAARRMLALALGLRRLQVRPQHPKTDPDAQEAFKKTSARRSRR